MGFWDRVGDIGKGFGDIVVGGAKFGVDVVSAGADIVSGDLDEGFQTILDSVQEDLLGQTLQGAFGPEGVIGSLIGALPEEIRQPGRAVIGPGFEAWNWVMEELVDRPLGTAATIINASLTGRPNMLFDGSAWARAWDINDKRTLGQSVAAAVHFIDPFDDEAYNKLSGDPLFNLMSGAIDLAQEIYLDPIERLARGAKNVATGKTVVATAKEGRVIKEGMDLNDVYMVGRKKVGKNGRIGHVMEPTRVYTPGGGLGYRPTDVVVKGIFKRQTKGLTPEQQNVRRLIANEINHSRVDGVMETDWWGRSSRAMDEAPDYATRRQVLIDETGRRMVAKVNEDIFTLIAQGPTSKARELTARYLLGDTRVNDELVNTAEELVTKLGPDENGSTWVNKMEKLLEAKAKHARLAIETVERGKLAKDLADEAERAEREALGQVTTGAVDEVVLPEVLEPERFVVDQDIFDTTVNRAVESTKTKWVKHPRFKNVYSKERTFIDSRTGEEIVAVIHIKKLDKIGGPKWQVGINPREDFRAFGIKKTAQDPASTKLRTFDTLTEAKNMVDSLTSATYDSSTQSIFANADETPSLEQIIKSKEDAAKSPEAVAAGEIEGLGEAASAREDILETEIVPRIRVVESEVSSQEFFDRTMDRVTNTLDEDELYELDYREDLLYGDMADDEVIFLEASLDDMIAGVENNYFNHFKEQEKFIQAQAGKEKPIQLLRKIKTKLKQREVVGNSLNELELAYIEVLTELGLDKTQTEIFVRKFYETIPGSDFEKSVLRRKQTREALGRKPRKRQPLIKIKRGQQNKFGKVQAKVNGVDKDLRGFNPRTGAIVVKGVEGFEVLDLAEVEGIRGYIRKTLIDNPDSFFANSDEFWVFKEKGAPLDEEAFRTQLHTYGITEGLALPIPRKSMPTTFEGVVDALKILERKAVDHRLGKDRQSGPRYGKDFSWGTGSERFVYASRQWLKKVGLDPHMFHEGVFDEFLKMHDEMWGELLDVLESSQILPKEELAALKDEAKYLNLELYEKYEGLVAESLKKLKKAKDTDWVEVSGTRQAELIETRKLEIVEKVNREINEDLVTNPRDLTPKEIALRLLQKVHGGKRRKLTTKVKYEGTDSFYEGPRPGVVYQTVDEGNGAHVVMATGRGKRPMLRLRGSKTRTENRIEIVKENGKVVVVSLKKHNGGYRINKILDKEKGKVSIDPTKRADQTIEQLRLYGYDLPDFNKTFKNAKELYEELVQHNFGVEKATSRAKKTSDHFGVGVKRHIPGVDETNSSLNLVKHELMNLVDQVNADKVRDPLDMRIRDELADSEETQVVEFNEFGELSTERVASDTAALEAEILSLTQEIGPVIEVMNEIDWKVLFDLELAKKSILERNTALFGGDVPGAPTLSELYMDDPGSIALLEVVMEVVIAEAEFGIGQSDFLIKGRSGMIDTYYAAPYIARSSATQRKYQTAKASIKEGRKPNIVEETGVPAIDAEWLLRAGVSPTEIISLQAKGKTSLDLIHELGDVEMTEYFTRSVASPLGVRVFRMFNQRLPHSMLNWNNTQTILTQVERAVEQAGKVKIRMNGGSLDKETIAELAGDNTASTRRIQKIGDQGVVEVKLVSYQEQFEFMAEIALILAENTEAIRVEKLQTLFESKNIEWAKRGDKLLDKAGVKLDMSLQEAYETAGIMKNNLVDRKISTSEGKRRPFTQRSTQAAGTQPSPFATVEEVSEGITSGKYRREGLTILDENSIPTKIVSDLSPAMMKQSSIIPRWDVVGRAVRGIMHEQGVSVPRSRRTAKSEYDQIVEKYAKDIEILEANEAKNLQKIAEDLEGEKISGKEAAELRKEAQQPLKEKLEEQQVDLDKMREIGLLRKTANSVAAVRSQTADSTMKIWRPLVLLTPKWALRIQIDETLRRAADLGVTTELSNLIMATRRMKEAHAVQGLDFSYQEVFDDISLKASDLVEGYGDDLLDKFETKHNRRFDENNFGDRLALVEDNFDLIDTSYKSIYEMHAKETAKRARDKVASSTKVVPSAIRGVVGATLVHPALGAAWAMHHYVQRWRRLNDVAQQNIGLQIAEQLQAEARKLLHDAILEEDVYLREYALAMLARSEGMQKEVERVIQKATNRGTIKQGENGVVSVNTELIADNMQKADALMQEAGFGNYNIEGAVVRNAYGDDSKHREMISREVSSTGSVMSMLRSRRTHWENEFKTGTADVQLMRLGDGNVDEVTFGRNWDTQMNRYTAIGSRFDVDFHRIIWSDEPYEVRVAKIAASLRKNKSLRERLKVVETDNFDEVYYRDYTMAAEVIVKEFDQVLPQIEGGFNELRARVQNREEITWNDVKKYLESEQAMKDILGREVSQEPLPRSFIDAPSPDDPVALQAFLNELGAKSLDEIDANPKKFLSEEKFEIFKEAKVQFRKERHENKPMMLVNNIRNEISPDFAAVAAPNLRTVSSNRLPGIGQTVGNRIEGLFNTFGTIPADELSRNPYFRTKYEREVIRLISKHAGPNGIELSQRALRGIEQQARKNALKETKDLLYDLAEETRFAEITRNIFPFLNAWQEVLGRWGRLTVENPAFVGKAWRMYTAPWNAETFGITEIKDENGNTYLTFRLPSYVEKIPKKLRPGVLGDITDTQVIRFSKEGLMSMVQSGMPGFGPLLTIPVREAVLKTPDLEETLNFMFPLGHPEGSFTQRMISGFLPAYQQNIVNLAMDTPTKERVVQSMALQIYVEREEAGIPIDLSNELQVNAWIDEANDRARNFFMFRITVGLVSPTSTTAISTYKDLQDIAGDLRKEFGIKEGDARFLAEYGEDLFALTARMTRLNDGVAASAVSEAARDAVVDLVEAHPSIGAFLTYSLGGSDEEYKFSQAVYRIQQQQAVSPSDPRKRRERKTVLETLSDVETELGWKKYDVVMSKVRSQQDSNLEVGLPTSLNHSTNIWLRDWKNQEIAKIKSEHPAWAAAFENANVQEKIVGYVDGFIDAMKDPHIQARPSFRHIVDYFDIRGQVEGELLRRKEEEDGSLDLSANSNVDLLLWWTTQKEMLAMRPEFSKIYDRYFARDMVPPESFVSVLERPELMVA